MRTSALTLVVLALTALVGCASNPSMTYQLKPARISLETQPSQARVTVVAPVTGQRTLLGLTPLTDQTVLVPTSLEVHHMPPGVVESLTTQLGMIHVIIEKDGYQPYEGNLAVDFAATRLHKIDLSPAAQPPAPAAPQATR